MADDPKHTQLVQTALALLGDEGARPYVFTLLTFVVVFGYLLLKGG